MSGSELLTGGRRRSRERHQTLRRAVDWSYDLLSADEQEAMARLAVFASSFDREAAQAVLEQSPGRVIELLASLVDKSLLSSESDGDHTRYRYLETIRQYAEDRLEERGSLD